MNDIQLSSAFSTLGIPFTRNRGQIRHAYAQKLQTIHPERDPEGWERLHNAYRAALENAQSDWERVQPTAAPGQAAAPPDIEYYDLFHEMEAGEQGEERATYVQRMEVIHTLAAEGAKEDEDRREALELRFRQRLADLKYIFRVSCRLGSRMSTWSPLVPCKPVYELFHSGAYLRQRKEPRVIQALVPILLSTRYFHSTNMQSLLTTKLKALERELGYLDSVREPLRAALSMIPRWPISNEEFGKKKEIIDCRILMWSNKTV